MADHEEQIYARLTGARKHYCPDWDFMAIDETMHEFEACACTRFQTIAMNLSRTEELIIRNLRSANFAKSDKAYERYKATRIAEDSKLAARG